MLAGEGNGGGGWQKGEGLKMGQLTLSKGLARMEICCHKQGANIQSKGLLSYNKFMHALDV
jgi:hypothetical protein